MRLPWAPRRRRVAAAVVLLLAFAAGDGGCTTISNTELKRDTMGRLMDVHDGQVVQWADGQWWWYGMGYQNCTESVGFIPPFNCPGIYKAFGGCGFRVDHAVNVYTSPDLATWTFRGNALPTEARPNGIYFRPKVIFNSATAKYVMWVNYLPPASSPLAAYPNATYVIAESATPAGPFTVVNPKAGVAVGGGGDITLFVDPLSPSATAYVAYDAWANNHRVVIEQLTPDYRNSLGANASTGPISAAGNEAPILFERKGTYFLLFGPTCCFCSEGSGADVWTAPHPLGPWKSTGQDLNPSTFGKGRAIKAQNSFVIQTHVTDSSRSKYIFVGDRWDSAPDKLKSHDFQYWQPLAFDDLQESGSGAPAISKLDFVASFAINLTEADGR